MTNSDSKKGKAAMSEDDRVLRTAVGKLESTEKAIQEEISEVVGRPSRRQREIIEELSRLHHSLRGPEDLLDRRSYSRPVPPAPPHDRREKGATLPANTAM
jgi:hypothetical protein